MTGHYLAWGGGEGGGGAQLTCLSLEERKLARPERREMPRLDTGGLAILLKTLLRILISDWLMISSVGPSLAARKMREILMSQATFAIILQDPMRLPAGIFRVKIAALGSLKNVTESIFKVSEC